MFKFLDKFKKQKQPLVLTIEEEVPPTPSEALALHVLATWEERGVSIETTEHKEIVTIGEYSFDLPYDWKSYVLFKHKGIVLDKWSAWVDNPWYMRVSRVIQANDKRSRLLAVKELLEKEGVE